MAVIYGTLEGMFCQLKDLILNEERTQLCLIVEKIRKQVLEKHSFRSAFVYSGSTDFCMVIFEKIP